ncbi:MAG: cation diffusion facilitator family transporter, partial [Planctomycetota bacterium]|nr:cation diffusion facilitator family transporter [Planctomycetota bacterium]
NGKSYSVAEVRRVTWVGLAINLVLSALKFAAGVLGSSQVVVADAVHSLSDATTDITLLVGVRFWSKPPDEGHPYGHRRIETVVTIFIAAALAAVGVGLAYRGLATLQEHHASPPTMIAFVAAIVSIVTKEGIYRWTVTVGRRIKSSAVVANAWHHRSDALSSIPAALAVAAAIFVPSWSFLDHVGAVLVSAFILHAAWKIARPALAQMIDAGVSEKVRRNIRAIAIETDGVEAVHAIRTRYLGSGIQVDLHVLVAPSLTVRRGHEISGAVKHRLLASDPDILDVVVHLEPYETTVV